nr:MAG TPA: hypothetical protein [Caudoviricetes sp.]
MVVSDSTTKNLQKVGQYLKSAFNKLLSKNCLFKIVIILIKNACFSCGYL